MFLVHLVLDIRFRKNIRCYGNAYLHIIVTARRQDSMSAASANAVLSVRCNRFVGYL